MRELPLGGCWGTLGEWRGVPAPAHFRQRRCPHALRAPCRPRAPAAAGLSPLQHRFWGERPPGGGGVPPTLAPFPSGYSPASSSSGGWRVTGRGPGVTGRVEAHILQAEWAQRRHSGVRSPSGIPPVPQRPGFPPTPGAGTSSRPLPGSPHASSFPRLPGVPPRVQFAPPCPVPPVLPRVPPRPAGVGAGVSPRRGEIGRAHV